jgi:feruloyl esterase
MVQEVAEGGFTVPGANGKQGNNDAFKGLPAFCRVAATMKPTADSEIKMELWLPATGWNGNFLGTGNGGWTGSISPATLAGGLKRGYAVANSDLGHEGGSAAFALGHPEKVIDFAYRATHEMTVKSKALIQAFYGKAPKVNVFEGCSAGGRQAFEEAQRYPADYDGIVAGSPGVNWVGRSAQAVWIGQQTHKDETTALPQAKFQVIKDAVLAACDTLDGVKDGVLENPRKCQFDPKVLACAAGTNDAPNCLTPGQLDTVRRIYSAVINPRTKQVIFPGHEPSSETGWNTMAGAQPFGPGTDLFKYVVFENPNWDYKTMNFDGDIELALKKGGMMNALDPNLKPFFDRGGKLVHYHGWADPQISPGSSVDYYTSVAEKLGGSKKIGNNYRLFMVPGMAHCGGGDGTSTFDMLGALERWVETKKAPEQIAASRVKNGQTDRTRPLCPYPQVAVYSGMGSIDEAANFSCKEK